ncbi:MAG: trypsin-like peptidase domain-containing protein [Gammaproteobacteria bacterium]|nr:trypsin-like peptidase domain-containing protein [Gammaproteobacteria bacterium]
MMLARCRGDAVEFLGSAFLVDRHGYLLTAAHLVAAGEGSLVVVPSEPSEDFLQMTSHRVTAMPVSVAARDVERDVALLRIEHEVEIGVPDDFLGSTAAVRQGASVMSLGYSYGHHQVHTVMSFEAVVSAKIRSRNDTALILFSSAFHEGDRGGPLIHVQDGHVIGIVSGRFEPGDLVPHVPAADRLAAAETNVSYAVAIEYGLALMEQIPELASSLRTPIAQP